MNYSTISKQIRASLTKLSEQDIKQGVKAKFGLDPGRVESFSFDIGSLYVDFSKTHISHQLLKVYSDFADVIGFTDQRLALFGGEKVNITEQRPALHMLLRDSESQSSAAVDSAYKEQASASRAQLHTRYAELHEQLANRSVAVTDIIHVGIGGSSLGPQLLFEALVGPAEKRRIHFVSNIDGHQLQSVLAECRAESTLVIGVSKTFTTAETLQNLETIGSWFKHNRVADYQNNFVAITANSANAQAFGIAPSNIVVFPAWVGGRYSVWSSVSLSAILLFGMDKFKEFLDGAASMDQHFYQSDPALNICFIAAALDHYYVNYLAVGSRAVFAYDYRLRSLVSYLQQLETESNGKDRQRDGSPVDQKTSAVVWGGVGTDAQHSVFQMLHQGTSLIPTEFLLVRKPDHQFAAHHTDLLANGVAQTAALLAGQSLSEAGQRHAAENLSDVSLLSKVFQGDRPSTTFLIERLTPYSLGALLAFYEHRTFCGGVLCNINSFDQMGVELGKHLATKIKPVLQKNDAQATPADDLKGLDPSTTALINRLNR